MEKPYVEKVFGENFVMSSDFAQGYYWSAMSIVVSLLQSQNQKPPHKNQQKISSLVAGLNNYLKYNWGKWLKNAQTLSRFLYIYYTLHKHSKSRVLKIYKIVQPYL